MSLRHRKRHFYKALQMPQSVAEQIQELQCMTVAELQAKHLEIFGTMTRSKHKDQLFRRLAWRIQELVHGGLSERAERRATQIANDLDARFRLPPRTKGTINRTLGTVPTLRKDRELPPRPGTILTREYRGETHLVTVMERGFEYRGKTYRSLSGVARKITGTQWSGPLFFGLRQHRKKNDKTK